MINKEFQPPKSWDDFENLCCDIWKVEWNCLSMQANGRQGQQQNGVDCYGKQKFSNSWTGIQCKRKQTYPEKKLTYKVVLEEVNFAKTFKPKLEHLIIATTFRRCSTLQEKVRVLSDEQKSNGLFSVSIAFWDDIENLLNKNTAVAKEYYKDYYSKFSDEERKLFLIKNPTKMELLDLNLQKWLGDSSDYLTFNIKNISEMPALLFSLRIFKKEEGDIKPIETSVNNFCFSENLKIESGKEQCYPLIAIENIIEQFHSSFLNKKVVGIGLNPNIPNSIQNEIMNESLSKFGDLEEVCISHSYTTFPIFIKYEYSSPFGTKHETLTGGYIYLQEIGNS